MKHRILASSAIGAALFVGCLEVSLSDYLPFPCPEDGRCPGGAVCIPSVGCVLEGAAGNYTPFACGVDGTCVVDSFHCIPEVGCVTGNQAADYAPFACGADGTCAADWFPCIPGVGCVPPETAAGYAPFACGADGSCAVAGYPCIPDVGCVPPGDAIKYEPFACAADGSCAAAGFVCLADIGCVKQDECSPVAQDCTASGRPKCSVVLSADDKLYAVCVPLTGSVGVDEPCTRTEAGRDDCAPGAFCSSAFDPSGASVCRPFCGPTLGCSADRACARLTEDAGVCVPACTLGDSTCSADRSCRIQASPGNDDGVFVCTADGSGAEWQACEEQCAHGLSCWGGVCTRFCNAQAGCGAGETCTNTYSTDYGFCLCDLFSSCPGGMSCQPYGTDAEGYLPYCLPAGTTGLGGTCGGEVGCLDGLLCYGSQQNGYFCKALCDDTHPCAEGTCHLLGGISLGGGVCL